MLGRNIVGPRVREARLAQRPRLTQRTLAAKLQLAGLDLDRAEVSKIESKIRRVYDYEVVALASALGVSAGWLLGTES